MKVIVFLIILLLSLSFCSCSRQDNDMPESRSHTPTPVNHSESSDPSSSSGSSSNSDNDKSKKNNEDIGSFGAKFVDINEFETTSNPKGCRKFGTINPSNEIPIASLSDLGNKTYYLLKHEMIVTGVSAKHWHESRVAFSVAYSSNLAADSKTQIDSKVVCKVASAPYDDSSFKSRTPISFTSVGFKLSQFLSMDVTISGSKGGPADVAIASLTSDQTITTLSEFHKLIFDLKGEVHVYNLNGGYFEIRSSFSEFKKRPYYEVFFETRSIYLVE